MDRSTVPRPEPDAAVDPETRLECFRRQCDEVELLQAVFCNPGEFVMHDELALVLIRHCVHSGRLCDEGLQSRIGFSVVAHTERLPSGSEVKIELVFTLPHQYPLILPGVFVRCAGVLRVASFDFNKRLQEFVQNLPRDVAAVMDIVNWAKENAEVLANSDTVHSARSCGSAQAVIGPSLSSLKQASMDRLWLYSHHIYSNFKRRDIVAWAHDLQLTGFSMPGKPGVICVEGWGDDIDEYIQRLRSHSWKKLTLRDRQVLPSAELADRKFTDFREITFSSDGHTRDFKELFNFLQEKGLGAVFKILFGVEGQ